MARAIGKCKKCKTVIAVDVIYHDTGRERSTGHGIYRRNVKVFELRTVAGIVVESFVTCWNCAARNALHPVAFRRDVSYAPMIEMHKVIGTKTDHECDARCLAATGFNCECACGGANHGSDHVAA